MIKISALFSLPRALLSCLALGASLAAQPAAETPPAKTADDPAQQAELLKSYLKVREELHQTQLAIVNNRVAGVTEKLDSIRLAMEAERERQQLEMQRQAAERERQQAETQRSNRTMLWVAAAFGTLGLIAVLLMPVLQWRTMNRMAEVATLRAAQLAPPGSGPSLLGAGDSAPGEQAVSVSNQRLMAVIDRMERRIFELEHSTAPTPSSSATVPVLAVPSAAVNTTHGTHANGTTQTNVTLPADTARRAAVSSDQATWIAVLLNKARSLVSTNKAVEALSCYDEILRLDPKHTEAMIRKGTTLERLNRFEEAIQCYERAIEADSKSTLAYLSKGGVCNRLGRYDEALKCYELALQAEEKAK
ncbi:MAG: tetratricopeptide repeat protein [Opitutaceae bacterium]|nr:tetratricopeptide repeat protein [Opitutaceae bacterium]